jgi:mannose/fructose/N-acetylgalactosamine-specific phosphotransferase system component IIC
MTLLTVLGAGAVLFGAAHVVFGKQIYAYYQRHLLFRIFSMSTEGAMRVHGAILTALGFALIIKGIATE